MPIHNWKYVESIKELDKLAEYCKQTGYCSHDFETSGYYYNEDGYPTMLGVCFQPGFTYIIPLGHDESPFRDNYIEILERFSKKVIEDPNVVKIAYNMGYEHKWFLKYGIQYRGRWFDTMLAKYLLDEERPFSLESQVNRFELGYEGYKDDTEKLAKQFGGWGKIPLEMLAKRCALDCDLTFRLWIRFENKLIKGKFYNLFRSLIMPLERVISESEFEGINIDEDHLDKMLEKYDKLIIETLVKLKSHPRLVKYTKHKKKKVFKSLIEQCQNDIALLRSSDKKNRDRLIATRKKKIANYLLGNVTNNKERKALEEMNFSSPTQLADFFFLSPKGLRLPIVAYTEDKNGKETNKPSTSEETILQLKQYDKHGFIDNLIKYRELSKLHSTYLVGTKQRLSEEKKIHASFQIWGTVTGRLCISDKGILKTDRGDISIKEFCPTEPGILLHNTHRVLTHTGEYQLITHGINKGEEEMFEVTLENGNTIECTLGHIFYTDRGWVPLREILVDTSKYHIISL